MTLTSPTLSSGFNYPPREGDVITLINLNAAGAVSGAIGDFPEGAVRIIGDIPVVTSYVGGNGNDVTLTVTNLPLRGGGTQLLSSKGGGALVPNDCSQLQRFAVFPDRADLVYGATHVGAGLSIGNNGISVYEHGANFLPSRLVYSNAVSGWTHVALVYANRRPRLYVNGVLVRSSPTATAQFIHASGSLGGSLQGDFGNFRGQLDEVRIWNVALSETQIQANMSRSLTGAEPGLVTYFRCDDAEGSALEDSAPASPNPNGALTDGAAFVSPGVPLSLPVGTDCNSGGGACESCFVVSGQFISNELESVPRLEATGLPSVCDPPKPCPGFNEFPGAPVRHVLHHFTNITPDELCVTAHLRIGCPNVDPNSFGVAAYLGEFLINQPCSNYLGDDGAAGSSSPPFSFRVPPLTNFVMVVTARMTNLVCEAYALELFGLPCPPPRLDIAHDAAPGKVRVSWSSAYPDYRLQSVNSLDGPGPHGFGNISTPPVLGGGKFAVTNAIATPRQFFRLTK